MHIRPVTEHDLPAILAIYNEGIEDRIATLETDQKDLSFMTQWYAERTDRYAGYVAEDETGVLGFISLDPYNPRPVYASVGEISVYITRTHRGQGIGTRLLETAEQHARDHQMHKLILFTFPFNKIGQKLYIRSGFRIVGTFKEQGQLNGEYVDVMAMEKRLR
ncbi:GCN5 family acetyltransferase [Exiguobacterium indicum]|uniref:arsinothricin resistance N-acetyltransferase ArsN1 family A n=1 Tax=Exiguobacterium indicum TaxID=296995 RepID=UPI000736FEF5|nr:arsinothricin resistance N-acetyltransferase ArsN1 family A [Exiguobacterium indicum]KTR61844.1 GCN5 family acetyltransferase [Exiguobacterium indicum]